MPSAMWFCSSYHWSINLQPKRGLVHKTSLGPWDVNSCDNEPVQSLRLMESHISTAPLWASNIWIEKSLPGNSTGSRQNRDTWRRAAQTMYKQPMWSTAPPINLSVVTTAHKWAQLGVGLFCQEQHCCSKNWYAINGAKKIAGSYLPTLRKSSILQGKN